MLPSGVALAAIGIAFAANAPTYALTLLLVICSGVGIAAYHPEGSKFTAYASGRRRASGMSLFTIGGNIGYALGPLLTTPLVLGLGLRGELLLISSVPGGRVRSGGRHSLSVHVRPAAKERSGDRRRASAAARWPPARRGRLSRRSAWFGLVTFVPLYEVSLGHSKAYGSHLLSLMLLVGAASGPSRRSRRPTVSAGARC